VGPRDHRVSNRNMTHPEVPTLIWIITHPTGDGPLVEEPNMDRYVMQMSESEKDAIDTQIAKYRYITNAPYSAVEHTSFCKLMTMLRPGYRPPRRFDIGGRLLNKVQATMMKDCTEQLQGKTVPMALDGWSNVPCGLCLCHNI